MKLTNITVIKELMSRHGVSFTKSLGQNFLINPSVCPKMAGVKTSGRVAVEIGAGIGVLTRELSKTADKVIVIEIDESLKPILAETLADCGNVEIIWGDVLEVDLHKVLEERKAERFDICANLPYYAATHIIMKLLEFSAQGSVCLNSITVMVQHEVAQRFTALPGSKQYGIVSVAARFYSEPEMLFKVSRGSFFPAPNVDSAVIRLNIPPQKKYSLSGEHGENQDKQFFRLVKSAFSERRKQLCNPVSKEFILCGIGKEDVRHALEAIGKNPASRAEELSVEEFINLYENISNRIIVR
ncbi:MAG: 16S rRNA (adenine(1518)-N(6)/adenine(1519)-N(6))-dimethyltransferase RsmA [Oscillospiraceae bacterium]|nr:16S rRNA (adenine(1518)-N(6)/adenine(1519)-N(6))-dimethyltransferase RsmA [Oscillospiraceae bacterium]